MARRCRYYRSRWSRYAASLVSSFRILGDEKSRSRRSVQVFLPPFCLYHRGDPEEKNDCSAAFKGYRLNEVAPQVGDLVCFSSGEDSGKVDYDATTNYRADCDIVVATEPGEIDVFGGNVKESVFKKTLQADSKGYLVDTTKPWFVVIQKITSAKYWD